MTKSIWPDGDVTAELLQNARQGEPQAVDALMDRHRDSLRRMIQLRLDQRLNQRMDVSDVIQDVLVEANRRLQDYMANPVIPFHLWIRQIAKDRIIDAHRRHRLSAKRSIDREQPQPGKGPPDQSTIELANQFRDGALTPAAAAKTVMFYVDVRDEVRTRQALPDALASGKRIVVPYCVDGELELFWLENMDELELGMYRILEPKEALRNVAAKKLGPEDLDLIMVPGVAFDRNGGRTGHGKGYYDKLLQHAKPETPLIALAFECQMFEEIPAESHDIYMDKVVTEKDVYTGKGRK